jgi:hypothetical protein
MEAQDVVNNSSNNTIENGKGKGKEHIYLKHLVDPRSNTVPTTERSNKMSKDLRLETNSKTPRSGKMYSARTSGIVSMATTKGFFITTKGLVIKHFIRICPWKSVIYFICQSNSMRSVTMLFMHFKGKNINVAIHVKNLNAQGNGIYVQQNEEKEEEHFPRQSPCFFMQKLLGEDNVPNDN